MSFNPVIANLLSTENLTVIQRNVRTAGFDVASRVLVLPILLPAFEDSYGMLIAHEVGHARYTTSDFNDIFIAASSVMKQYYNVCEDVRVEKLIKRQYPGLRKVMAEGYAIFNKNNFFIPAGVDANSLIFIDRINVHFKVGFSAGVIFTDEELKLVHEVERAESINDVVTVAKKIYALSKTQLQNKKQNSPKPEKDPKSPKDDGLVEHDDASTGDDLTEDDTPDAGDSTKDDDILGDNGSSNDESTEDDESSGDGESTEDDDSSVDGDSTEDSDSTEAEKGESTPEKPEQTDAEIEKSLESVTESSLSKGIEHAASSTTTVTTFSIETKFAYDPIHSYKNILANFRDSTQTYYGNVSTLLQQNDANFETFITSTKTIVSHMFKEFEMKKNAHRQRHTKTAKSGRLDSNKLFAYKIREELFKSISVVADDTNHGMLFLLDWSGSMTNDIHATLCQLMSLTMFCRKAKIPFRVFAFSGNVYDNNGIEVGSNTVSTRLNAAMQTNKDYMLMSGVGINMCLLELFSDKMSEREYTRMSKLMFARIIQTKYSMSSTPLNEALIYMHSYISEYKRANDIEKLTFVVLTDGEADAMLYNKDKQLRGMRTMYDTKNVINKIIDPITRDAYSLDPYITPTLLDMIRKSANCSVVGFFVCEHHQVGAVVSMNYAKRDASHIDNTNADFKKEGYTVLTGSAYNKLYLVNSRKLREHNYAAKIDKDMSAAALSREMVKVNNATVSNKLMMGKLIGEFATGHK